MLGDNVAVKLPPIYVSCVPAVVVLTRGQVQAKYKHAGLVAHRTFLYCFLTNKLPSTSRYS